MIEVFPLHDRHHSAFMHSRVSHRSPSGNAASLAVFCVPSECTGMRIASAPYSTASDSCLTLHAGISVPDNKQKDSYERIEAPVRSSVPDGGPPVAERREGRDDMMIQIDGAAEKE